MLDVKVIKIDLSKHEFIYFVPLSDTHIGAKEANVEKAKGYIDWIASHDNAYTLLNGDLINGSTKESTPELYDDLITPDEAYFQVVELFKPIKHKILAITSGGHEGMIFKRTGTDYMRHLAREYDIEDRYTRTGGFVIFNLKPLTKSDKLFFTVLFTHGWGTARTKGAKTQKIGYFAQAAQADVYVLSHDHWQSLSRDNYLTIPSMNGKVEAHRKMLVTTGGFLGYSGYPISRGYQPADMGTPRVRIGKRIEDGKVKKDIHASL